MARDEIPPGTLYMLILRTLARQSGLHGYEIASAIQRVSKGVLQGSEGGEGGEGGVPPRNLSAGVLH